MFHTLHCLVGIHFCILEPRDADKTIRSRTVYDENWIPSIIPWSLILIIRYIKVRLYGDFVFAG